MSQFARPDSDISTGLWAAYPATSSLYTVIDEIAPNDSDYIYSSTNPSFDTCIFGLSDVGDPQDDNDHVVRYRYSKSADSGRQIDLEIALLQGSTIVAYWSHTDIPFGATAGEYPLSSAEAASITDYSDLRVAFRATAVGTGDPRFAAVSWAELEVPSLELQGSIGGGGGYSGDLTLFAEISGSIAGAGSTGASLVSTRAVSGSIGGAGTLSADLWTFETLQVEIDAQSAVFGSCNLVPMGLNGAVAASSVVLGILECARCVSGSTDGQSVIGANLYVKRPIDGSIDADGWMSAKLREYVSLSGSIDATSFFAGTATQYMGVRVDVDGQSSVVGDLTTFDSLKGGASSSSSLSGSLSCIPRALVGEIAGESDMDGVRLGGFVAAVGNVGAAGSLSADAFVKRSVSGSLVGQGALSSPKLSSVVPLGPATLSASASIGAGLITYDDISGAIDAASGFFAIVLNLKQAISGHIVGQSFLQAKMVESELLPAGAFSASSSVVGNLGRVPLALEGSIDEITGFVGKAVLTGDVFLPQVGFVSIDVGLGAGPTAEGPAGGGYLATIVGENFKLSSDPPPPGSGYVGGTWSPTVKVQFGSSIASDVRVLSSTLLTCVVPAYGDDADVDPIPPVDIRIVNLDEPTGEELGGPEDEVTVPDAFTYRRPVIGTSLSSDLMRLCREVIRMVKRQVHPNVSLTTHTDFDDSVADALNITKLSELPGIVLVGPQIVENRFYSLNKTPYERVGATREHHGRPAPRTVDLTFQVVGVADKTYVLLNLLYEIIKFFENNDWLNLDRDGHDPSAGQVRYELDLVDEPSVRTRANLSNVRHFEGSFVIRGFDIELDPVETTYDLDAIADDGEVTIQVESF